MTENFLHRHIRTHGPITTREFMARALHDPEHGYYAKGRDIGAHGDFYTSANISLFTHALGRFLDDAASRLDGPRIVELGGGTGLVAAGLDRNVTVIDPNVGMATRQRERGLASVGSVTDLDERPTIFYGNEILDAMPVHRLVLEDGVLRERYVALKGDALVEIEGEVSDPRLLPSAASLQPHLDEGAVVEINLDADKLLRELRAVAPQAIVLFIDYGGAPAELYGATRPHGTLRGYHQHRPTDALERPGEQDITADVNFDHLTHLATAHGYGAAGYRTQGEWLADLSLLDDMMKALTAGETSTYLAAKNLLMPGGMGERFKAAAFVHGIELDAPLHGFRAHLPSGPGASPGWI